MWVEPIVGEAKHRGFPSGQAPLPLPTEAAAVACLYALFLGLVVYRTLSALDWAGA